MVCTEEVGDDAEKSQEGVKIGFFEEGGGGFGGFGCGVVRRSGIGVEHGGGGGGGVCVLLLGVRVCYVMCSDDWKT